MPKIDIAGVPERRGSTYPSPFREKSPNRIKQALGDAAGLTQFGVNLTRLPPGEWSSQRHWHREQDEFVFVLSGTLTLITDQGRVQVGPGECAGFPRGAADGHHFINEGHETAVYLEVGTRTANEVATYPDVDLHLDLSVGYTRKNGEPYR